MTVTRTARLRPPPEGGVKLAAMSIAAILVTAAPAVADDTSACADGIAMIKDVLAKAPPDAVAAKLKKSLRAAEREQAEAEYDECLDAIGDAKRTLGR